jgi:hypothetical protein
MDLRGVSVRRGITHIHAPTHPNVGFTHTVVWWLLVVLLILVSPYGKVSFAGLFVEEAITQSCTSWNAVV